MRVGLIGDNSIEYVDILLRIWNENDCAVLIDWRIPFTTIVEMLQEADVEICHIDEKLIKNNNLNLYGVEFKKYKKESDDICILPEEVYENYKTNNAESEALILFSSGTTGKSKGAILTHRAINENANMILEYMHLKSTDIFYIAKTFSHSSTLIGELLVCLKERINLYVASTIMPPRMSLDFIDKNKITTVCVNPSLMKLYIISESKKKHSFDYLRNIYISGSIADEPLLQKAQECFINANILNVYGLTEAGPRVTAQTCFDNNILGSVGKPIKNVKVEIRDADNKNFIQSGIKGIIFVNTISSFSGYISNNHAEKTLDGWINTGDIGYLDNDGNLYIVGRYDNMISVGSHNVYPEEIEKIILTLDEISDCVVTSEDDSLQGKRLICNYMLNSDCYINIDIKIIRELCQSKLAPYEVPSKYIEVIGFERTYSGKNKRIVKVL